MSKTLAKLIKEDIDAIKKTMTFDFTIANENTLINMGITVKDDTSAIILDAIEHKPVTQIDKGYFDILEQMVSITTLRDMYSMIHMYKDDKNPIAHYNEDKSLYENHIKDNYKYNLVKTMMDEYLFSISYGSGKLYIKDNDEGKIAFVYEAEDNFFDLAESDEKITGTEILEKKLKEIEEKEDIER